MVATPARSERADAGDPSESVASTSASLTNTHEVEFVPGLPAASARYTVSVILVMRCVKPALCAEVGSGPSHAPTTARPSTNNSRKSRIGDAVMSILLGTPAWWRLDDRVRIAYSGRRG